ncbi:MAG: SH3 domain-containing protein [Anaerolinea sp.]|nr:SH3 domain-containing protein [Anaerolinea sp.]
MSVQYSSSEPDEPLAAAGSPSPAAQPQDLEELRRILLGEEQGRLAELGVTVDDLQRLLADKNALAAIIAPSLEAALRDEIQQRRDEMIEVLYPIIGQTVLRAVREAIQDLARGVDARVRMSLAPSALLRRLRARASGVSGAELALRDALPFEIAEVFVIHRASGLLLRHVTPNGPAAGDRDLVSGMLTAVRDFAADAFGRGQHSELDAIHYGQQRILIEAAEHVYVAAVVEGIEPAGFRAELRDLAITVEIRYRHLLRQYHGDAAPFAGLDAALAGLGSGGRYRIGVIPFTGRQKRFMAGAGVLVIACLLALCLGGWWLVQAVNRPQPTPLVIYVTAAAAPPSAATPTATAAPSATPTATALPAATATATATALPAVTVAAAPSPTPVARVAVVDVRANVRAGPGLQFPIKTVAAPGDSFDLVAQTRDQAWVQVCCLFDGSSGWIAAAYLLPVEATPTP